MKSEGREIHCVVLKIESDTVHFKFDILQMACVVAWKSQLLVCGEFRDCAVAAIIMGGTEFQQ